MKKVVFTLVFMAVTFCLSAQVSKGDVELVQKYFGVEKAALLKDYMKLTPAQDSLFWPVYNKYESERAAYGQERIGLVDAYLKNVSNITEEKAKNMVDKGVEMEKKFKDLQKKYFNEMSKKIGPVKAAQFYQFENYLNNVINLSIQENIPFIGELEQKHSSKK